MDEPRSGVSGGGISSIAIRAIPTCSMVRLAGVPAPRAQCGISEPLEQNDRGRHGGEGRKSEREKEKVRHQKSPGFDAGNMGGRAVKSP